STTTVCGVTEAVSLSLQPTECDHAVAIPHYRQRGRRFRQRAALWRRRPPMAIFFTFAPRFKVDNMSMSSVERNDDLADFTAGWRGALEDNEWITVTHAVIGLTNFGEKPAPSFRLAEVLARSVSEAEDLAQRWGWPGTRVKDGLIFVNPERAP